MITVRFHGKQIRGLPHLSNRQFKDAATGQIRTERAAIGDTTLLKPGVNQIPESVLEDYHKDPEIKALLLKGAMGGIEILAVDGKPQDHEDVLQALYPPAEIPSLASRMKAAAEEMRREAEILAAGTKNTPEEVLPATMPITTEASELAAHPDPEHTGALAAKLEATATAAERATTPPEK